MFVFLFLFCGYLLLIVVSILVIMWDVVIFVFIDVWEVSNLIRICDNKVIIKLLKFLDLIDF